jgi:hypothetical protein
LRKKQLLENINLYRGEKLREFILQSPKISEMSKGLIEIKTNFYITAKLFHKSENQKKLDYPV